jgi:hypothetical protein
MKTWPLIISIVIILAIVCSPALAISKSDLIAQYMGQSPPAILTPVPTPTSFADNIPSTCPENLASCQSVKPYFGPVEIVDPLHLRIEWNVSAFLPKLIKQNGLCYKSDPLSQICSPYKFVDTTSISGLKVQ